MTEVVMPQMGESIAEGTITKWLVKVGDTVEMDQPLFEISTDKVDAEIPSPASGTLLEIRHQEGDTVEVDAVVAVIGDAGEEPVASPSTMKATAETPAPAPVPTPTPGPAPAAAPIGSLEARVRTYSSPVVRKIAAAEGIDISIVPGTGIHGRVTKKDIVAFIESGGAKAAAAAAVAATPASSTPSAPTQPAGSGFWVPPYVEGEEIEIEKMSRIRQITADHMVFSKRTSAHVTTMFHFDMTRVVNIRNRAKRKFLEANGTKLTYMPFIFKAIAASLKKHRQVNASVDGHNIIYKKRINIGMAVALDRGLIVPVIKDADELSLVGLAKEANGLADRARTKKLKPDEIRGGTFTVTNPGVFGSLFGTPVINQPQVAIMGIGTIEKRARVLTDADGMDQIAIRTMSYFGITYDHRLVDGADADHFMNDVKAILEEGEWPELNPYI